MKINEVIKTNRIKKGLTQEKLADILGVSTPAVSKWESGASYPDITLLPPLARSLGVDLNTLLSFKENLTKEEIGHMNNDIAETMQIEGYASGYEKAKEMISEYPNSDSLKLNLSMILQGGLTFYPVENKEEIENELFSIYNELLSSNDEEIRNQVVLNLVGQYTNKGEYDKAEELVEKLPSYHYNKRIYNAMLQLQKGDVEKSFELYENELLHNSNNIYTVLTSMIELAVKENNMEDALYYSDLSYNIFSLIGAFDYYKYMGKLQYAISKNDEDKTIEYLKLITNSLDTPFESYNSPIYKHINLKENVDSSMVSFKSMFLKGLLKSDEFDFIKENADFKELINELE